MSVWANTFVYWTLKNTVYFSIPFTWEVLAAKLVAKEFKRKGKKIVFGGPGALLLKETLLEIGSVESNTNIFEPVIHHNPLATFTSRGCPNKCSFCAVPKVEGSLIEIPDFIPRPIVCDNNFTATSKKHILKAIDKLKKLSLVDFNQGLESKLFTPDFASELQRLKGVKIRFAFDNIKHEKTVVDAINLAFKKGFPKSSISIYVLVGYKDTLDESLHKVKLLKKMNVDVYPMRYQPLNTTKKNNFVPVDKGWTDHGLKKFCKYWRILGKKNDVPYEDFEYIKVSKAKGFGFFNDR